MTRPRWIGWRRNGSGWVPVSQGHDWFDTLAALRRLARGTLDHDLCVLAAGTRPDSVPRPPSADEPVKRRFSGELLAELARAPATVKQLAARLHLTPQAVYNSLYSQERRGAVRRAGKKGACQLWAAAATITEDPCPTNDSTT